MLIETKMIAVDTSSLTAFFANEAGEDVEKINIYATSGVIVLPPVVLSEILSDFNMPTKIRQVLVDMPTLEIANGYWQRVGLLRAKLLSHGLKARLADTLIAQICVDHDIPLITRDKDFRHFVKYCGLKLLS